MAKPTEMWKLKHKHSKEIEKVLLDTGNLGRYSELVGWIGRPVYKKLQRIGHTALDFAQCDCSKIII